jgi:hypothetical protein
VVELVNAAASDAEVVDHAGDGERASGFKVHRLCSVECRHYKTFYLADQPLSVALPAGVARLSTGPGHGLSSGFMCSSFCEVTMVTM